ncbi:probable RNA polymerase II nuclear localization protein SLC7A6OS [Spodoptera frugiperda]|uniref:Probable RNA polymerase II nuclear localization protein SLC7A6OS n=1 Tax=Spodoptera frugiperda TaxID=7108 RepID=A0A9R0DAZ7_SPOFR|nr:probable RNA polymerase II nuclear localization protein SLC7A6OS [Spodoptera frugiperda]
MASSTVLRVKRRLEENPQDTLVLMCKRIKTDKEEISPSLFVFRGTVDDQETTHVKNLLPKTDIKQQTLPNVDTIIEKLRKERKEVTTKSRYEIVNCSRGLKDEDNDGENTDVLNLIDLQKTDDKDGNVQYAYDLYTSLKQEFDISMIDNFVGVETGLVLDSYDPTQDSDHEADDDDDSNDENNWRNDYPDSEASSIDVEDMVQAMQRVDIEDDLSSDTGEDKIYDDPPDILQDDAQRYGSAYAKYKAKVLTENPDLSNRGLILCHKTDDDDDPGYKNDSDDGFYYGEDEDTEQFREQYRNDSSDDNYPD